VNVEKFIPQMWSSKNDEAFEAFKDAINASIASSTLLHVSDMDYFVKYGAAQQDIFLHIDNCLTTLHVTLLMSIENTYIFATVNNYGAKIERFGLMHLETVQQPHAENAPPFTVAEGAMILANYINANIVTILHKYEVATNEEE